MSDLSRQPDASGFYWGSHRPRVPSAGTYSIAVRQEQGGVLRWQRWFAYVNGEKVGGYGISNQGFQTMDEAERAACLECKRREYP